MNRFGLIVLAPLVLVMSAMLAAAAPASGPRSPGAHEGLVYFYHARTEKRRRASTYIKIDRKLVADLDIGFHTYVYLPAGEHALGVRSGGALTWIGRTSYPLVIEGGKTHYIRYTSEGVGSITIPDVTEPPAQEAKEELTRSIYLAPKKGWTR